MQQQTAEGPTGKALQALGPKPSTCLKQRSAPGGRWHFGYRSFRCGHTLSLWSRFRCRYRSRISRWWRCLRFRCRYSSRIWRWWRCLCFGRIISVGYHDEGSTWSQIQSASTTNEGCNRPPGLCRHLDPKWLRKVTCIDPRVTRIDDSLTGR